MSTPPQPHKPAFPVRVPGSGTNPWIVALGLLTAPVALVGIVLSGANFDPESASFDPVAAAAGHALLIAAAVLLAGTLTAGAINWQLRHR